MKTLILILLLMPPLVLSAPEGSVYPNSGPTDARTDENADISTATSPQSPDETEAAQKQEAKVDNKNSRPEKDPDDFKIGPYDKNGIYRYIPEVRDEVEAE